MLSGDEVERIDDERPDFVRLSHNESNGQIILGVEHFRVDHLSKQNAKKSNVIQASNMADEKKLKTFIEDKTDSSSSKLITEENAQKLLDLVASQSGREIEAQYNDYITSFKYSLDNHLANVEVYKKTLSELAEKNHCLYKLAFLIEIHSAFRRLFFNDENGSNFYNDVNQCIFFQDIVDLLEKIDHNQVDYIILCFGDVVYGNDIKAIAFRTGEIRNRLQEKGLRTYKYYGEDFNIAAYNHLNDNVRITPTVSTDSTGTLQCSVSLLSEKMQKDDLKAFIENACYYALLAQKNGGSFITTTRVQYIMDVYSPYIKACKITSKGMYGMDVSIPTTEKKEVVRRKEAFHRKCGE